MLYLSRKEGESIIINDTIELTVMEIKGRSVKLGFVFPQDASILRKELYEKIRLQNIEALTSMDGDMLDDLTFDPHAIPTEQKGDE
jgi:carbon storage regulator